MLNYERLMCTHANMLCDSGTDTNTSVFFLKSSPLYQERRLPPPVPKKPPKGPHHHPPLARDRSLESSEKQRQEARKRLMAAKRAASVRQNSATESADSIEIYIPEAQTRLWKHWQGDTPAWREGNTETHMTFKTQKTQGCPHQRYGMGVTNVWIFDMTRLWFFRSDSARLLR